MAGGLVISRREIDALKKALLESPFIGFDSETDGLEHDRQAVGMSFSIEDGTSWYLPLRHDDGPNAPIEYAREMLREVFCEMGNAGVRRVVWIHNKPFDLHVLRNEGIDPARFKVVVKDSMMLAWLINPDMEKGLKPLVKKYFGYTMVEFKELLRKYGSNSAIPVNAMAPYAIDDVRFLPQLVKKLRAQLAKSGPPLVKAFRDLETPVGGIIDQMQATGFLLDVEYLAQLDREFAKRVKETEKALSEVIGLPISKLKLGSTQWLSVTFIDTLKWWRPREERGDNGHYSTRKEMMVEWAGGLRATKSGRRVAKLLLEHRKFKKLRSTYTTSLAEKCCKQGRLHTTFKQAGTRTGRFSSSQPNLQNIPVRTDEGRLIRKAFIAQPGFVILDADYSQVELRLMAHFSQDPTMLEIYRTGGDIHQNTADSVGCQRFQAKGINFGLNYGMGPHKLALDIGSTVEEARRWKAGYFREYIGVKHFHHRVHNKTRQDGFVTTLVGRRRYFPKIKSRDNWYRSQAERQSVNTKIQGSAGDIIKIAMRNIVRRLKQEGIRYQDARLISQVHDELILEVRETLVERVAKIVKEEMERAVTLSVPLIAEPEWGKNWGEAH